MASDHRPRRSGRPTRAVLCAGLLVLASLLSIPGVAAETDSYDGRAIGLSVQATANDLTVADTGPLPSDGGAQDASMVHVEHDLVEADVLVAWTVGADGTAQSEATVSELTLLPGSTTPITSTLVRAHAMARCEASEAASELAELEIAGETITVTGEANQTLRVDGAFTLVLNEQSWDGDRVAVNAIHLTLDAGPEIIVSHAAAGVGCSTDESSPRDFVTAGGFLDVDRGRSNFGFVAGYKPNAEEVSGHVNAKLEPGHLRSTSIDTYEADGDARIVTGQATLDGDAVEFRMRILDAGEPGEDDEIRFSLSTGYVLEGAIDGGNLQLHD